MLNIRKRQYQISYASHIIVLSLFSLSFTKATKEHAKHWSAELKKSRQELFNLTLLETETSCPLVFAERIRYLTEVSIQVRVDKS